MYPESVIWLKVREIQKVQNFFKKNRKKVLTAKRNCANMYKLAREQRTLKTIQSKETQTTVNNLSLALKSV